MKPTEKLFDLIPKLDPVGFIGLARLLRVNVVSGDSKEPRKFTEVLEDILKSFDKQSRVRKREILQIVKAYTKKDASNTEHS